MKAIIVDDDSFIRQVLRMILAELSVAVAKESQDFKSAQKAIDDFSVDVIFLDIMLPDGNGLDLIQAIKTAQPECKILMISGAATKNKVEEAISLGADGFIVKPFNANVVVKNIANSLNIETPGDYGT